MGAHEAWPALPLAEWRDTYATLHMWTQIVGKLRLEQTPWINHAWHVTLHVTATGLTTSAIPHGDRAFQVDFDFCAHKLLISTSNGEWRQFPLQPMSVAAFYRQLMTELQELGLVVRIQTMPNEVADAIPFDQDETHASYDAEYANRFWRILVQTEAVLQEFRAGFIGKCSPVHFFWGSFDLAVTRFSGRTAPPHPGGVPHLPDRVAREAYSHEVSSCGFWPGGGPVPMPVFYSYAYPEPQQFKAGIVLPEQAFYSPDLKEFVLLYDAVRQAEHPSRTLLAFLQSTYEAAAVNGMWDRATLEKQDYPLENINDRTQ